MSAHDMVIEDLYREFLGAAGAELAVESMRERRDYGLNKYGVVLHKNNGRDYWKDVDDELGDLVAYLRVFIDKHPQAGSVFGDDYRFLLRLLIRWRTWMPAFQSLESS